MENGFLTNLITTTGDSLSNLWAQVLNFLPSLIGAIVVLLVGLIVASLIEKLVERIMYYLHIDSVLKKAELETYFERANIRLNVGVFFGKLVFWFILIASLLAASDILQFAAFSNFLNLVLLPFIPRVVIAVLIMLAAMVVANFLRQLVAASVASAKLNHAKGLGALTWWVVVIFGFLTALPQVGVQLEIIMSLTTGLIYMLALAGGLAFGLGGKEHASRFLTKWGDEMKK